MHRMAEFGCLQAHVIWAQNAQERSCQAVRGFWLPFADWAGQRNITICLEKLWESDATIQKEVVSISKHPNLKASFDNGHALVFSKAPASDWVNVLADDLAHCHLHDKHGEGDEHAVIAGTTTGSGVFILDWRVPPTRAYHCQRPAPSDTKQNWELYCLSP
jgi:sugar phosphate isomerase/epimerase